MGHDCEHICVNSNASFYCKCRSGFILNPDKRTCSPRRKNAPYGCSKPLTKMCCDLTELWLGKLWVAFSFTFPSRYADVKFCFLQARRFGWRCWRIPVNVRPSWLSRRRPKQPSSSSQPNISFLLFQVETDFCSCL